MQKRFRLISFVLTIVLLLNLLLPGIAFATEGDPVFEAGSGQGLPGDAEIQIPIHVKNNPGISSAKLSISFDTDRLELTGASISADWDGQKSQSPSLGSPYILNWVNGTAEYTVSDSVFATLTFSIKDGAQSGNADITITYDPDDVYDLEYNNVNFYIKSGSITVLKAPLSTVSATVDAPAKGSALSTSVAVGSSAYSGVVTWYKGSSASGAAVTGTAQSSQVYTAQITLTATSGETFAESLNGTATAEGYAVTRSSDTVLILTKTFPATAAKALQSISVEGTPKTAYTYAENLTLDMNGAKVKASYDDGTTDYITGYTVTPEKLVVGTTSVTLAYQGKSTTIDGITVSKASIQALTVSGQTVRSNQITTDQTVILPALPAGATYGAPTVGGAAPALVTAQSVANCTLTFSTSSQVNNTTANIQIPVSGGQNYLDSVLTVTVTAKDKEEANVRFSGTVPTTKTVDDVDFILTASAADQGAGTKVWSWASSDSDVLEVIGNGNSATVKAKKVGTAAITVKFESETHIGTATASITVSKAPAKIVTAPTAKAGLTYTGSAQVLVNMGTAAGGAVQYAVGSGAYGAALPTATDAGTYTVKYKAIGDANHNDTLEQALTVTISKSDPDVGTVSKTSPSTIYPHTALNAITLSKTGSTAGVLTLTEGQTLAVGAKDYSWTFTPADPANYNGKTGRISLTVTKDKLSGISIKAGTAPAKASYHWGEEFVISGAVIEASYESGSKKTISADRLTYNKTLTVGQTKVAVSYTEDGVTQTCDISGISVSKADARTLTDIPVTLKDSVATEQVVALSSAGMPTDAGTLTYAKGTEIVTGSVTVQRWSVNSASGEAKFTLSDGRAGDTVTLPVTISSANYADSVVNVKIVLTDKDIPVISVRDITKTYDSKSVAATEIQGSATFNGHSVEGVWTWKGTPALTNVADSGVKTVVFTPADINTYTVVEATFILTINKAVPTGTPTYTKITTAGKTLADTALTIGSITPPGGTIIWDDEDSKEVAANTSYGWTYTPADTANYALLTGRITPYPRSTGGGRPSNPTQAVTNPDGSKTTTVTDNRTGTVTATTEKPDGTVEVMETKKDGTVINTVTAPDGSQTEKVTDPEENVTITVTNPKGGTVAKVKLPATIPAPETHFEDINKAPWAEEAVHTVIGLNLMEGIGNNKYDPVGPMTRGSLATVFHRLSNKPAGAKVSFNDVADGKYYTEGVAWAAKVGVVTGFSADAFAPEDAITREQLAVMLARYAKLMGLNTKADSKVLEQFADGDKTGEWAADGVAWCVENGILKGKSNDTLDPAVEVSRAEVAVMLNRFIGLLK